LNLEEGEKMNLESAIASLLYATLRAGTPLLLGTLGEVYAERSGVMNLGVEGMMIMGAVVAFGVSLSTKNVLLGILAAALIGGLLSLIHAFLSISLRANQVVSGIALTTLGLGVSSLIGRRYIGIPLPNPLSPLLLKPLTNIPVLGKSLFNQDIIVYMSIILAVILWLILFKTSIGIRIRSVGENPAAADAAGVNVFLIRYLCVFFGGVLSGIGGAYLSVAYFPSWREGMTMGMGWIVIGLTIFAMWNPLRAIVGAYLFGGIMALQFKLQPMGISPNLLAMLPYASTIVALLIRTSETMRKRIGAPLALGIPYEREEKTY